MISCLLIHVTQRRKGLPAYSEARILGESIQLGRGAGCQIHLPDHRVNLLHATLKRADDGTLLIETVQDALIGINGFVECRATLRPGMSIAIGPYLITVEASSDDADLSLRVDMPETQAAARAQALPTTLAALAISKRGLGLKLAAMILLVFLVLPLASRSFPALEAWQAALPIAPSGLLSPGPLVAGHTVFGMKCSVCHRSAFRGVADSACTQCHKRVAMHLATNASHQSAVAEVRCTDCHAAHRGKAGAMNNGLAQCVDCHARLGIAAADARDFGSDHPRFHLTVPAGKQSVRVRQDGERMPREKSGLKFSHQVHLDKKGVSSPDGRTTMTCRDCHLSGKGGQGDFAPMSMGKTCQQSRCHKMRFEEPVNGIVPHGPEREVMNRLRHFYTNRLADAPEEIAKECASLAKTGAAVRRTLDCAALLAQRHAASTLFQATGDRLKCSLCHEIDATGKNDVPWKVASVRIGHDWQPKATFVHAKHDTIECTECHDKTNSRTSADISFPPIEKCRECHGGANAASGKIKGHCANCHSFHRVAR